MIIFLFVLSISHSPRHNWAKIYIDEETKDKTKLDVVSYYTKRNPFHTKEGRKVENMKWNSPQVNRKGVMKAYVDEYSNHAYGILQEDTQNGFDAYPEGTLPKEMKIQFKYDADKMILYYRDFRTNGMAHCSECEWGTRSDDTPCTNDGCGWGCYHNLAYSGKSGHSLGSRGMGKSLRIESGEKTIVNTTLSDGRSMASIWQIVEGDWKWGLSPEDTKNLSQPGTEIITYGIKENVHNELVQHKKVVQQLQEKWFRLIDQGAEIQYILIKNSKMRRIVVPKMKYPPVEKSEKEKPTRMKKNRIVVKSYGKRVGELRNFEIYYAKEPFDDEDPRHGIAIVKNGKQTITRYNQFPTDIPEDIRRRIFGHVDADCQKEPFLNEAENSTHTGYRLTDSTWKAVRTQLNRIIKEFAQPFIKAGGERVTAKEQREAQEILVIINKALSEIPELQIFGLRGEGPSGSVESKPKSHPYISRLEPNNKRFNWGDTINVRVVVKNPLGKEIVTRIEFNFFDPTPVVIRDGSSSLLLLKGAPENPYTSEEKWAINVDDSMVPGIHWIQVELKDKDKNPILNDKGKPEKVRASVYIEQDPATIHRRPRRGTGMKERPGDIRGDTGEGGLANLQFFKRSDNPDLEAYIEMARAAAFVNRYGRRYRFLLKGSNKKATPWLAVGEVIAEKLIERKSEFDIEEGEETWSAEDVKSKLKEIEDMKIKFLKAFMEAIP